MNLSEKFFGEAKRLLASSYGAAYAAAAPRSYQSRAKNVQEAHEAIRPTEVSRTPDSLRGALEPRQLKLYDLIWRRAVASQMPDAELETTTVDVATEQPVGAAAYAFRAAGSVIAFDGWRRLYPDDGREQLLPPVASGDPLALAALAPAQHSTEPPPRYSEATLIKALEEYGIGRPSTYAPTVSTIVGRGYVERVERALKPTELAFLVNDLLVEHFPKIVDYQFTAHLEGELDEIAEGTQAMVPVLHEFYEPFKKNLDEKEATLSKAEVSHEATDELCERCGKPMVVKWGRFGKFLACTGFPECKNTKPLPGSEEAAGTDEVCAACGKPMQVKRGRFGVFLGCSGYPECKNIKRVEKKTGVTCPTCGQGDIVEKRSKRGRNFYSCNRYPDCKFSLWSKPTGEKCPGCGALLVLGAKATVRCSKKGCGYSATVDAPS
jgi:DNA topoisomerase-1